MVEVMVLHRDYHFSQNTITLYNRSSKKIDDYLNDKDYYNQVKKE